ncbi:conserved hypothetical protein [Vibrio crassostreae]|nr:conserved hypothetical protein [Vibrio crassostreae]
MIKFDTTELNQSAYLLYSRHSYSSLRITEKQPHGVNYIQAPKLICYMIIFKLINKLQLEDFEFENHKFTFRPKDSDCVEELFDLYKSVFDCHSQYLVILYEDSDNYPQYRFEFDTSLKGKIINAFKGQNKHLDLLQIASCMIIDSISVRDFGGHIEVINRLGAQPST